MTKNGRLRNFIEENSDPETIFVFKDVRTQEIEDLAFRNYSTIIANDPGNKFYAGVVALLINTNWTTKQI